MDFTSTEIFYVMLVTIIIMGGFFFLVVRKNSILQDALSKKQSLSYGMGRNTTLGDIYQSLGVFAILTKFDDLITLSTTSRQASLDILAIKWEEMKLYFIEFKKKGANITTKENKLRRIIKNKNVEWVALDVDIPDGITVEERELPKLRQRN